MPAKRFIDTNVLLYAIMKSTDKRCDRAKKLLSESKLIISTQVVNEAAFNLIKKSAINEKILTQLIRTLFLEFEVVEIGKQTILTASELRQKFSFSYWDSLLLSSALLNGCEYVFSEDMQHELILEKRLQIINPFL